MKIHLLLGVSIAIIVSGCSTTLQSRPLSAKEPREGIGYVLPFTQWTITSSWRLDYCPSETDPTANGGRDATLVMKIDSVAGSEDDGDLAFMVNPQELQTLTSITAFEAKWHDGRNTLSSVNASLEDRSAQVVGNVVKTAVKILPLFGVPAAPGEPGAAGAPRAQHFCADGMDKKLAAAKAAKATLLARQGVLKAANDALADVAGRAAAMGAAVDEATKSDLSKALKVATDAAKAQLAAEEDLSGALKPITYVSVHKWPESGNLFKGKISPNKAVVGTWFKSSPPDLDIHLMIERVGNFGREPSADVYSLPDASSKGLRYRMPAKGRLTVCSELPCSITSTSGVLASFESPIAQLGYVNVLPFRGRTFGSNSFKAEFALDGSLKSAAYEQKAAPAEVGSAAMADAASQIGAALDPLARLEAGNSYLKALKERQDALEALERDPIADRTSDVEAENALLSAELERLRTRIALEELRATVGTRAN